MNHAAPAAAAAARAAKHAVCAMAKAQQKAKAKIRWAIDVGGLLLSMGKLGKRNKKLEEETESLKTTVEELNQKLAQKRVNNPYGCKGKPKQKPPVSPRRSPTKREERTPRKTPSKKKGGWGGPLASAVLCSCSDVDGREPPRQRKQVHQQEK